MRRASTGLILVIFLASVPMSYFIYGTTKPQELSNKEYIQKARLLGNDKSDVEILLERDEDLKNKELWKISNAILKAEKAKRGLGSKYWNLQDNITDEALWFYSDLTVEEFVDSQYKDSKYVK